jgi:hypothetical protein
MAPEAAEGRMNFDPSAYSRFRKLRNTFWFFSEILKRWPAEFEATQSRHIAKTNQLETETVKRIKARFRRAPVCGDGK